MLNQEDLQKIGVEVGKVIEQNIMPALDQMLTKEDGEKFATKEDLDRFATKEDLRNMETRFCARFSAIENELADIRLELEKLSKRVKEDTDALASDVVKMRQKLNVLEKEVNMLKLQLEKV